MPFINELIQYSSLSIVGLGKNTGKTECLNYILAHLPLQKLRVGVSSAGIDGERTDQVTQTAKPEIFLRQGVLFTTSEKHYRHRRLTSELMHISQEQTSLGRLITGKVQTPGKVLLSGPPATASLKRWIQFLRENYQADLCIVDGALSRMSTASPAVSESMVLTTGAAVSVNMQELVSKTAFTCELIHLEKSEYAARLMNGANLNRVQIIDDENQLQATPFSSVMQLEAELKLLIKQARTVYIPGALTDRFLKSVSSDQHLIQTPIVVRDFTCVFASPMTFRLFLKKGGQIKVLEKSKLIALCVNPVSPGGYRLDSDKLCDELADKIQIPVYDIVKNG
ncbi:MAG: hypothetical protein ACK4VN_14095 [Bacteroidales bacterium]